MPVAVRLAPGVRVSVSSRGVHARITPSTSAEWPYGAGSGRPRTAAIARLRAATALPAGEVHRTAYAPARRPLAPPPPPATGDLAEHYGRQRDAWQARLDRTWTALTANEPAAVLAALADAYEESGAPAAAVGAADACVTLVVVAPADGRGRHDRRIVCAHVLAAARQCFAAAPGTESLHAVAVRGSAPDAYGRREPEVLLAGGFTRSALQGVDWAAAEAEAVVDAFGEQVLCGWRHGVVRPVPPAAGPGLAEVAGAVRFDVLAG